jgi:hypothetical protein
VTLLGNGKSLGNENENTGCECYIICFTVSLKHKVYFKILREILHNWFFSSKMYSLKMSLLFNFKFMHKINE